MTSAAVLTFVTILRVLSLSLAGDITFGAAVTAVVEAHALFQEFCRNHRRFPGCYAMQGFTVQPFAGGGFQTASLGHPRLCLCHYTLNVCPMKIHEVDSVRAHHLMLHFSFPPAPFSFSD